MQTGKLCNLPRAEPICGPWSDSLLGHTVPSHHTALHVPPFPESSVFNSYCISDHPRGLWLYFGLVDV